MGEDTRQDSAGRPSGSATERVSVPQAADHLGTTVDAIRKRVQRGTIRYEKDADGRVWVLLDTGRPRHDTTGLRQDSGAGGASLELAEELRDRIRYLERQVEEEREARRRADTILAQLSAANAEQARTIRAIEAPAEERREEPPESAEPRPDRATPAEASTEAQEATETSEGRSWWRRMFGG